MKWYLELTLGTLALAWIATAALTPAQTVAQAPTQAPTAGGGGFNGLEVNLGNLFRLSSAKSRSICPESFTGEKGKAAMAKEEGSAWNAARDLGQGWKVSPFVRVKGKSTFTVAEIDGPGAIQHIWMTPAPLQKTRWFILRFYWDGEAEPSVEVPMGDFFACGWGRYCQISSLAVCVNPGFDTVGPDGKRRYTEFTTPYTGLAQAIRPDGLYEAQTRFGLYRWHIPDPIRFEADLKVTIQALGWQSGGRYLPLQDDIASVAFWYQTEPHGKFPRLPGKDELEWH
ncbi:MAG: DUF2961 domain-containing protein [Planctomycetes bacterium]|nr:DUF2961 domain-containing protein [Planctomycetota bacterium]